MPEKVSIGRLSLTDFRNYRELTLRFAGKHVVFTGNNGAGKTNLLEAISLLSPGRGMRRIVYSEAAREGSAGGFTLFAEVEGMAGPATIGTTAGDDAEGGQRRVRINGAAARTNEALLDHLRITWLTPAMDGLFSGPAGDRRRFLDRMVLAVDPGHGRRVADYEKAMRGRNRLLSEGRFDRAWLEGIEAQLAELAVAIAVARQDFVRLLTVLLERAPSEAASRFPKAEIKLTGFMDDQQGLAASDMEARFAASLAESRWRDEAAGRMLEGPHRQDLEVVHAEKSMPAAQSSTGEQKALLVGLVLAHARLVGDLTGAAPILLLDEIAAHLDPTRRAALFSFIDDLGGQAFMTGTDAALFSALEGRAQFLSVNAGTVTETVFDG